MKSPEFEKPLIQIQSINSAEFTPGTQVYYYRISDDDIRYQIASRRSAGIRDRYDEEINSREFVDGTLENELRKRQLERSVRIKLINKK